MVVQNGDDSGNRLGSGGGGNGAILFKSGDGHGFRIIVKVATLAPVPAKSARLLARFPPLPARLPARLPRLLASLIAIPCAMLARPIALLLDRFTLILAIELHGA